MRRLLGALLVPALLSAPALAQSLDEQVAAGGATAMMILQLFDTGGCINPDGSLAVAGDGHIDPCEVANNNIIPRPRRGHLRRQ